MKEQLQPEGTDIPDPRLVHVAHCDLAKDREHSFSDSTSRGGPDPCQGGRTTSVKTDTQPDVSVFTGSLGHARKPAQLEERRCCCVFLLGYKLPEQRARARCLIFCSCEYRRWNLLVHITKASVTIRTYL